MKLLYLKKALVILWPNACKISETERAGVYFSHIKILVFQVGRYFLGWQMSARRMYLADIPKMHTSVLSR